MRVRSFVLVSLLVTLWPLVAAAQMEMFGPPPKQFVAPGKLFAVTVPSGWEVQLTDDPYQINFAIPIGDAMMFVRRVRVPAGAKPRQVMLNAIEDRLRKMPGYKELGRKDTLVAGIKGARVTAVYYFQGNIQFPRAIEEVYLVVGEEAFVFHFECFEPAAAELAPALNVFYKGFIPRPVGGPDGPYNNEPSEGLNVNNVPF